MRTVIRRNMKIRQSFYDVEFDDLWEVFVGYRSEDRDIGSHEREEWKAPTLNALKVRITAHIKKKDVNIPFTEIGSLYEMTDKSITGIHATNGNFLARTGGSGKPEQIYHHGLWGKLWIRPTSREKATIKKLVKNYEVELKRLRDFLDKLARRDGEKIIADLKKEFGLDISINKGL